METERIVCLNDAAVFRDGRHVLYNKYFIDGRDPDSYTGVDWIFGLHDRPWTERPVFDTVRHMNAPGLERTFDIEGHVRRVEELER